MWSPGLGKNIGYVWVPIELAEPGNAIQAESEHGTLTGSHREHPVRRPAQRAARAALALTGR